MPQKVSPTGWRNRWECHIFKGLRLFRQKYCLCSIVDIVKGHKVFQFYYVIVFHTGKNCSFYSPYFFLVVITERRSSLGTVWSESRWPKRPGKKGRDRPGIGLLLQRSLLGRLGTRAVATLLRNSKAGHASLNVTSYDAKTVQKFANVAVFHTILQVLKTLVTASRCQ